MRKDIIGDWGADLSDAKYGYALADAAMRKHVLPGASVPAGALPYPKFPR